MRPSARRPRLEMSQSARKRLGLHLALEEGLKLGRLLLKAGLVGYVCICTYIFIDMYISCVYTNEYICISKLYIYIYTYVHIASCSSSFSKPRVVCRLEVLHKGSHTLRRRAKELPGALREGYGSYPPHLQMAYSIYVSLNISAHGTCPFRLIRYMGFM